MALCSKNLKPSRNIVNLSNTYNLNRWSMMFFVDDAKPTGNRNNTLSESGLLVLRSSVPEVVLLPLLRGE